MVKKDIKKEDLTISDILWDEEYELPEEIKSIIKRTRKVLNDGYHPIFHLGQSVSPICYLITTDEDVKKEMDLVEDNDWESIQIMDVPLPKLAEVTDIPLWILEVMYLDLNNYITKDFHNAMCSCLSLDVQEAKKLLDEGYEFQLEYSTVPNSYVIENWWSFDMFPETHGDFGLVSSLTIDKFVKQAQTLLTSLEPEKLNE